MEASIPASLQPLLAAYLSALTPLQAHWYGIYLYGSLVLGDFQEQESDIDLIVLTQQPWTDEDLAQLERVHLDLFHAYPLAERLAPLYVPLQSLEGQSRQIAPYPYASDGQFHAAGHFDFNAVTRWMLKHHSLCLFGPDRATLPLVVTWEEVVEAMRYNLDTYWAGKAATPELFLSDYWVVFAVTTLCRILTTLEEGEIIGKTPALTRWRDRVPSRFQALLDEAWRLRTHRPTPSLYRSPEERMSETVAFLASVRQRGDETLAAFPPRKP